MGFTIPDEIWTTIIGALLGSLIASGIVAFLNQHWIEGRELRGRRDVLRLDLYVEVVDLILENERIIAERGAEGTIPPNDLQHKRLWTSHRLKLLGSKAVNNPYEQYRRLVFQETQQDVASRPDPNEVR